MLPTLSLIECIQHQFNNFEAIMSALTALLLGTGMALSPPGTPAEQPTALHDVVERLRAGAPSDPLIKAGVKLIAGTPTQLPDELALLSAVAGRRVPKPQLRKEFEDVAAAIERKYRDDRDALVRVLLREADLYRDCLSDRKTEGEILERVVLLQDDIAARQAVSRLDALVKLGETYLGVVDAKTGTQKKAVECYAKVISFEFPGRPTGPHYGDYQAAYTKAACRLVEMAKDAELKNLRFHPFVWEELERLYPEKIKAINGEPPGVAEFNAKVERWLKLKAADLPKGSPLRGHIEALLQSGRKDEP